MYFSCTDAPNLTEARRLSHSPQSAAWPQAKQISVRDSKAAARRHKHMLQKPNHMMLYPAFKNALGFPIHLHLRVFLIISEAHDKCVIKAILLLVAIPCYKSIIWFPPSAVLEVTRQYHFLNWGIVVVQWKRCCVIWPSTSDKDFILRPVQHAYHIPEPLDWFSCASVCISEPHCIRNVWNLELILLY